MSLSLRKITLLTPYLWAGKMCLAKNKDDFLIFGEMVVPAQNPYIAVPSATAGAQSRWNLSLKDCKEVYEVLDTE